MANPVKGQAPLVLTDGREFKLVLDMEAMVEAESRYGKPLAKLMTDAREGFMGALAALLMGALSRFHPNLTRSEALDLIRTDADKVTDSLTAAAEAAFPEATEGNGEGPPSGKTSGGSGAKQA